MLRQWKCPMCGSDYIREQTTHTTINRNFYVNEYGQLELDKEILSLEGVVSYYCAWCGYEIPKSVNNMRELETYIGEDTDDDA